MQIPSVMPTVSSTLMLQAPFTAITALIIFRAWSVYGGRSLKHLAIGWSLWTSRMIVASFLSALAQAGVPTYAPGRRALSALGVALAVAVLPFLVSGTLSVANVVRESDRAARWSLTLAGIVIPLSLVFSAEGAPAGPRVALLLFCVTVSFGLAFGYVAWRLLRHPADSLTLGRQLAAFGFAAYAVKQLFNLNAYLSVGQSGTPSLFASENMVLIAVAMGTVALLFERDRDRAIQAVQELRRLEGELAEQTRLDSVGRLAGGVAHDFNNMLTALLGNVREVRAQVGTTAAINAELIEIESTAKRAAGLTQQLLAVARREEVRPELFDVVPRLASLRQYLIRQAGERCAFTMQLPALALFVLADPDRFDQMVINLVANGRDALEGAPGTVTLSVSLVAGALDGQDAVVVRVIDTGIGMDVTVQSRIFEPFFTTKAQGQGTGLGLASVHGAVVQAGGRIDVESAPGAGSRFDVLLPVALPVALPIASDETPVGGCTVLVVDDEPTVRQMTVRTLHRCGYTVYDAEHAEAALRFHAEHAGRIDLLLTDIRMPGLNGRQLAARLVERDPTLAVAYMSGYDDAGSADRRAAPPGPFIAKPFEEVQLLEALTRARLMRAV